MALLSEISRNGVFHDVTGNLQPRSHAVKFRGTARIITRVSRSYQLKRRAEHQDQTRQRIIEATIELHQTIGPKATTVSEIAERAEVGRVTVYRHFPDEPTLARACSGQYFERHPLPDPNRWRAVSNPVERLRTGLRETYAYHGTTQAMISHV